MPRGFREAQKPGTSNRQIGRPRLPRSVRSNFREGDSNTETLQNRSHFSKNVNIMDRTDGETPQQSRFAESLANEDLAVSAQTAEQTNGTHESAVLPSTHKLKDNSMRTEASFLQPTGSTLSCGMVVNHANKPSSLLPVFMGMQTMAGSVTASVPASSSRPPWMHFLLKDQQNGSESKELSRDLKHLKDEVQQLSHDQGSSRKERTDLLHPEEELERERNAREEAEQVVTNLQRQLSTQEERVRELEKTLSEAQKALEQSRRSEALDWIISRNEIQISENSLGVGGWGTVVEGKFRGCKVAVKQIHQLILSPHNRRLFEREMNIASRCRHPCLLQFIGATNDDGNPLFVTELMDCSLRALLEQRPLSQIEIIVLSSDVAQALNYLHLNRPSPIIHRDISSANVLLWKQGDQWRGKVSDYGTANFMHHTMTVAPGAVIYSAPEALTSAQTVKVDVYSFGVLVCEMCIRELPDPQRREEQVAMVTNHLLRGFVRRCVQVEAEIRPSMEEIINRLEEMENS